MLGRSIVLLVAATGAAALSGCGSAGTGGAQSASASGSSGYSAASSSSGGSTGPAPAAPSSGTSPYRYGPSASAKPASSSALLTTKHGKLGTILAFGRERLTVYMFAADHGASSSCTGACAQVWPPVTGTPRAVGGAHAAELGTIKRADGTTQVTYKGHPLYLYARDQDGGDAYGQGIKSFGAAWYALTPSGATLDRS